ncbi:MAG TPA: hypothetical protein VFX16_12165 [Pseudonocardiaceae bacterium]|nr:hypothetical protein [Pseudonocardiaceae bacterium]
MKQPESSGTRLLGRIGRLVNQWIDRLFAAEDAHAMAHGWEVRRIRGGGRAYRDPRWNYVRRCEFCGGGGQATHMWAACEPCGGTGVIRSAPAASEIEVRR